MSMRAMDKRGYGAFRAVSDFFDQHPVEAASADMKANRAALKEVVSRMTSLAERREVARAEQLTATVAIRKLRRRLEVEFISPVRQLTAQLVGANPGLGEVLQVPRPRDLVSLMAAARAVATAAKAHAGDFTAAGLLPDYAERLASLLDELAALIDKRARGRAELSGVVAALAVEGQRGRFLMRLLDRVVAPVLEKDPGRLKEWKSLRRTATAAARVSEEVTTPAAEGEVRQAA